MFPYGKAGGEAPRRAKWGRTGRWPTQGSVMFPFGKGGRRSRELASGRHGWIPRRERTARWRRCGVRQVKERRGRLVAPSLKAFPAQVFTCKRYFTFCSGT